MHQPPQQEPENLKDGKAPESTSKPPHAYAAQIQYQQHHQQHLQHLQQQIHGLAQPSVPRALEALDLPFPRKRKLHAIEEKEECSRLESAYDADVDDDVPVASGSFFGAANVELTATKLLKIQNEREHIYELFQPWALKTYGDQAKTKTITLRKKARILKALEGKEHSRPDSSKFRFWVKSKGFTTKRPEGFQEAPSSQRRSKPLPPNAILSEHPSDVDLFVASTSKDFGKRIYRKVAVVEEFFDIIYNVHMELGGRSGMHAGQKRTYRIITETYGFLPREAVTRFLSICPECKKNLRPSSPATSSVTEDPANESSSEVEVLNYSSHTESSLEAGPTPKTSATAITKPPSSQPQPAASIRKRRHSDSDNTNKTRLAGVFESTVELPLGAAPVEPKIFSPTEALQSSTEMLLQQQLSVSAVPKLRINPQLQRPTTPPLALPEPELVSGQSAPPYSYHPLCFDMKARENLVRYYEFMRRFYAGGFGSPAVSPQMSSQLPVLTPPIYGSDILQGLRFPTSSLVQTLASTSSSTPLTKMEDARPEDDSKQKTKKFKTSPDSRKVGAAQTPAIAVDTPATPKQSVPFKPSKDSPFQYELQDQPLSQLPSSSLSQSPQLSAINLTKQLLFRSNGTPSSSISASATLPTTSTPTTSVKLELSTSPPTSLSKLRIPQVRAGLPSQQPLTVATATSSLPPLDLERLKPITSTYLQLTRSMGLSDEDALRFDNLVSKDFKYTL